MQGLSLILSRMTEARLRKTLEMKKAKNFYLKLKVYKKDKK